MCFYDMYSICLSNLYKYDDIHVMEAGGSTNYPSDIPSIFRYDYI